VLVRGENNRNMIAQIDTMWTGQGCTVVLTFPHFSNCKNPVPHPGFC
jgi:hypothetical protein